jgi:spermidine synthase
VLGSLAAGFVMIRFLGLGGTLVTAAATNFAVGLGSLWLASRLCRSTTASNAPAPAPLPAPDLGTGAGLLAVMASAGVVTLGLEVLWTRVLVLSLGTTTYAFATMLTSFLVGLTAGSIAARVAVDRIGDLRRAFGWLQLGIAASVLATIPIARASVSGRWLEGTGADWLGQTAARFGISLLVMLVPTAMIGASFPWAGKIWTRDLAHVGGQLGRLYAANTAGNVAGAIAAGFVLLPLLGIARAIVALALLSLLNAAWAWLPATRSSALAAGRTAVAGAGIVAVAGGLVLWRPAPYPDSERRPGDAILYYREGSESTVAVVERAGRPDDRWMAVDGIRIGQSLGGVDAKQQVLAHFPFLLHAGPVRDVVTIGLGTGITLGQILEHTEVREAVAVELSPAVIEAARSFAPFHGGAFHDPRSRIVRDDGMNWLRRSDRRWDAIVSACGTRETARSSRTSGTRRATPT